MDIEDKEEVITIDCSGPDGLEGVVNQNKEKWNIIDVKPTLAAKLAAVLGEMTTLQKNGVNSHFRYKFAEAGDVYEAVRPALSKHGVGFVCSIDNVTRANGHILLEMTMSFLDGDSGHRIDCKWFGEALDKQDKGINKAATAASKYFLLKTFMIATADELETDRGSQRNTSAAEKVREKAPAILVADAIMLIDKAETISELVDVGARLAGLDEKNKDMVRVIYNEKIAELKTEKKETE